MIQNTKPYYWYTIPSTGKLRQFSNLIKAKKAAIDEKSYIKIWKYTPGHGSHIVFETTGNKE